MTKLFCPLTVLLVGSLAFPRTLQAGWDSKDDNKPVAALEGMTDKELFNEGFDVCIRRASIEPQGSEAPDFASATTADASDYLGVIYQVTGKKHDGIAPSWMLELSAAYTVKKCQGAFRTFLALEEPVEPTPVKKTVRRVAKKGLHTNRK